MDDIANFKHVKKALSTIEFTENEQTSLFAIIASVIHLGMVNFLEPEIEHGEVKLQNGRPVNVVSKVPNSKYLLLKLIFSHKSCVWAILFI